MHLTENKSIKRKQRKQDTVFNTIHGPYVHLNRAVNLHTDTHVHTNTHTLAFYFLAQPSIHHTLTGSMCYTLNTQLDTSWFAQTFWTKANREPLHLLHSHQSNQQVTSHRHEHIKWKCLLCLHSEFPQTISQSHHFEITSVRGSIFLCVDMSHVTWSVK